MIKSRCQQQLNEPKDSIAVSLQAIRGQVAEVQKSQAKMWSAINRMGNELWELATIEDSSKSIDEEQKAGPEDSLEETTKVPHTVTNPTSLFGILPKAPAVPFGTFDDMSVRDSVSSTMQRQPAPPIQEARKPTEGVFTGEADTIAKGKFLYPMVGSPPP